MPDATKSKFLIKTCGDCPMFRSIGGGNGLCLLDRELNISARLSPPVCCPVWRGPIVIAKDDEDYAHTSPVSDALFDADGFASALEWLCTEPTTFRPDQNEVAMRARREWRRCLRNADNTGVPAYREWRAKATVLGLLLTDSGEPL